ncbi:glutathione transferase GstA [Legionella sp.]|uniref:glutathione transferase GstA n=1 Tax=Legionella sp. TaxID=459 RepID=UPI003CB6A346
MKLFFSKGACSLATHIIINELALISEYEAVDLITKKTATGNDFLKINPKGAVPTLITGDNKTLTENAIILQYLADTNNATQLLPTLGDFKRYRVLEWLNYVATELHKGFGPLWNPDMPQEIKNNLVIPLLKKKFTFIDKHLQNHKFLSGEHFTLPDAYLFVMLLWAANVKIDLSELFNLSRYFSDLKKRDSILKSLKEEDIAHY